MNWIKCNSERPPGPSARNLLLRTTNGKYITAHQKLTGFFWTLGKFERTWIEVCRESTHYAVFEGPEL